jgi:hypothetical protein
LSEQIKPVAWHTEDEKDDKSATTYDEDVAENWRRKGWPVTPMFYANQHATVRELAAARKRVVWVISGLRALFRHTPQPAIPEGYVLVPRAAVTEVLRISDRQHPAWEEVRTALLSAGKENNNE